jgi:hypothetical protein
MFHFQFRCGYQQQRANVHSVVTFICPSPGLKGNTISVQHNSERIFTVEIEALGKLET